jgi:low affinity Fe/Cu permease
MTSVSWFTRFAAAAARAAGHPAAFAIAASVVIVWALTGPVFGFGNTWQLMINTSTTIVTFLLVFVIQNSQNRDTEALQIKLDELIRSAQGARIELLDLEELDQKHLERIKNEYEELARRARENLQKDQQTY